MRAVLAILFGLALVPLAAGDDFLPLAEAKKGHDPEPDLWSMLEERALGAARLDTSGGVQVMVLPIEFPDQEGTTDPAELEAAFFGDDARSLAGYYRDISGGTVKVTGEVHPWVRAIVPKKYLAKLPSPFLAEAYYRLLLERLPEATKGRLGEFDVLVFVMAGPCVEDWMTLLWPHAGGITDGTRDWQKIVLAEKSGPGETFDRRVIYHEFGHSLGIADKYCYLAALGISHECEVQRIGRHCLMGWGRSPCAWCRIQMGWVEPTVLATRTDQAIRLAPLEKAGGVAKIYLGTRSKYLLVSYTEGQLRVWRLGEPWRRFRNHLLWIDLDCALAEKVGPEKKTFELPGGVRLADAHVEDGELKFRIAWGG